MTTSYVITCCSTADMPEQYLTGRDISYACFHFRVKDREYGDDLGKPIITEDFYQRIRDGAMPITSQVNPEQYEAMFNPILGEGKDIIHLTLSTRISGIYNSAAIARDEMQERYPDRRIEAIDSLQASVGYGLLLNTAWGRMQAGTDYEKLVTWIKEHKLRLQGWFFTMDLTHSRRGGRISVSAAFFGNMLDVCPPMNIDHGGKLIPRDKCRGKRKVIKELVERTKTHVQDKTGYSGKCFICHSSCPDGAQAVASLIKETFPHLNGASPIMDIGTVIGSRAGPGTVGALFWGDERVD